MIIEELLFGLGLAVLVAVLAVVGLLLYWRRSLGDLGSLSRTEKAALVVFAGTWIGVVEIAIAASEPNYLSLGLAALYTVTMTASFLMIIRKLHKDHRA